MGILRRAFERGKALPKKLERALKIQAGLALPDGQVTDVDAYHINQRDEGIDLQGVSGALMATSNMQMQTFVTQASENTEGFDGYNGFDRAWMAAELERAGLREVSVRTAFTGVKRLTDGDVPYSLFLMRGEKP